MKIGWLKSIFVNSSESKDLQRPTEQNNRQLLDVAHEALQKENQWHQETLRDLAQVGWPLTRRKRFRKQARRKVKQSLFAGFASNADEEDLLEEEITDRLVEVAENDPHYQRIFEENE